MKNVFLSITLLIGLFSYAQDSMVMSKENRQLYHELMEQENQRLDRVESFLKANPNVSASLGNDGRTITYIYDVVQGKPIYRSTDNLNAARATKTYHLWNGGSLGLNLDGSGMTVGVWDGGPADASHVEFQNSAGTNSRVTIIDNVVVDGDTGTSSHGTHVSGTIAANGSNINAIGMAYNVNIKSYNWSNDEAEIVAAVNDPSNPIILSNHSYGIPINGENGPLDPYFMGGYTQDARDFDNIARNNPKHLVVASAGNSGNVSYNGGMYPGFDKLTNDKNAKNILVVANANPTVTEQPLFSGNYEITTLAISGGSSEGPTDDLRIKPDIAADGTNLFSTTPNNTYSTFSGTSMSAPNTTGTLALLQQYYNQIHGAYMNSSTLRGLVCHTAIDDSNNIGPDPIFGWGFLDAKAAAETITNADNALAIISELNLNEGETYTITFAAQAGEKLSATICWTDLPGEVAAVTNETTAKLVNDLDIRISDGSTTFLPWKLDFDSGSGYSNSKADNSVDNIEKIEIDVPVSGVYTLTVSHKGNLQGTSGGPFDPQSQDFSLIVTGNSILLGVDENELARNLLLYPNPTKGEFTISFEHNLNLVSGDVMVNIYDVRGRVVHSQSFKNSSSAIFKESINMDNTEPGVYMVNISAGNRSSSHKLIVN